MGLFMGSLGLLVARPCALDGGEDSREWPVRHGMQALDGWVWVWHIAQRASLDDTLLEPAASLV